MGVGLNVVLKLRNAGHDVLHLRDQSLQRMPDLEIFAKAAAKNRIVLTFDLDFAEIAATADSGAVLQRQCHRYDAR
jgi:predicted nuclease of predicted toxin-antitoxin system